MQDLSLEQLEGSVESFFLAGACDLRMIQSLLFLFDVMLEVPDHQFVIAYKVGLGRNFQLRSGQGRGRRPGSSGTKLVGWRQHVH